MLCDTVIADASNCNTGKGLKDETDYCDTGKGWTDKTNDCDTYSAILYYVDCDTGEGQSLVIKCNFILCSNYLFFLQ